MPEVIANGEVMIKCTQFIKKNTNTLNEITRYEKARALFAQI